MKRLNVLLLSGIILLSGCGIPDDIEATTEKAMSRGHLRAGWVAGAETIETQSDGDLVGFEIDIVDRFADSMGISAEWTTGSEHELMKMLEDHRLDVVVGGVTRATPWGKHVGLTAPMRGTGRDAIVAAVPKGENRWLLAFDRLVREGS